MNRMRVHDLYAHTTVPLNEATTARAVGDYVPVRSLVEGKWYAVYLPSNNSHNILDIVPQTRKLIEREINTFELTEALMAACANVRAGLVESADTVLGRDAVIEAFGLCAYTTARARARKEGFTEDEVNQATAALDEVPALERLEENTVCVSDLLETA